MQYEVPTSPLPRILPRRTARTPAPPGAHIAFLIRHNLLPNTLDPIALQQLHRTSPPLRISLKTAFQKFHALLAQLVPARQLRGIALRDVVHDCPFVVEAGPGAAAGAHFKDDAAEGPDVDGAEATFVAAFDYFGGHVHGGAGHGFLLLGGFGEGGSGGVAVWGGGEVVGGRLEGFVLAGYDFCGAEVDVFDYAVVVEEDVWWRG